jgi:hypothetical protein
MYVDFEKVKVITILQQIVVVVEKTFFKPSVFLGFLPISLHNLFRAISDEFKS